MKGTRKLDRHLLAQVAKKAGGKIHDVNREIGNYNCGASDSGWHCSDRWNSTEAANACFDRAARRLRAFLAGNPNFGYLN
jgi:hypothetical protein